MLDVSLSTDVASAMRHKANSQIKAFSGFHRTIKFDLWTLTYLSSINADPGRKETGSCTGHISRYEKYDKSSHTVENESGLCERVLLESTWPVPDKA